ncbi:MAG: diguanylate cyclase [Candidatus Nanopelagicales bacterium]
MTFPDDGFEAKPTILVIDDDRVLTMLMERLLAATGEVTTSNSGAEGLQLAREMVPDLILLDVQMPGQDGFDIISELKSDPTVRHIPVIFITAEVLPEIESHCLEAGAADYIAKPVTPRVLQARARTHLLIKHQADQLADLSFRDALTGALNRPAFEDVLGWECDRAAARGWPVSLLIVDLDQFRGYNEVYGHLAGDDVLEAVAQAIRPIADRPGDLLGRLGGDRFGVLLPETASDVAVEIAERINAAVRQLQIRHTRAQAGTLTASVGVASTTMPVSGSDIVDLAERMVSQAKAAGRDRVHPVSPHPEPAAPSVDERPAVDESILLTLADDVGDRGFVEDTVEVYLAELPDRVEGLVAALRRAEPAEVRAQAHSLKSSSAMLGAVAMSRLCAELERVASAGPVPDPDALQRRVRDEAAAAEEGLRSFLSS